MNRLFDSTWRDLRLPDPFGRVIGTTLWPTLGVSEKDQEYVVTAELPGMEEKDIELSLDNGELVIRGEKKSETSDDKNQVSEHYYGRFERRLNLGSEVDREKVNANFKNGVLTVTLPKSPQAAQQTKRIPINDGT